MERHGGTYRSLFIDRQRVLPCSTWLDALDVPRKGYKHRPGWHACAAPYAPHLSRRYPRCWVKVELGGKVTEWARPTDQGGIWYTATRMRIVE